MERQKLLPLRLRTRWRSLWDSRNFRIEDCSHTGQGLWQDNMSEGWWNGRRGRNRTCNRRIRNPMLYPFELRAHADFILPADGAIPNPASHELFWLWLAPYS